MDINKDKDELYRFYKKYCQKHLKMSKDQIYKDFKSVILTRYDFMPYFFVCELQRRGYDLTEEKELF